MRSSLTLPARLFIVSVAVSVVFAEPVGAHTDFDYSLPTDGASVGEPVSEVTVAFTLPVTLVGNGFEVLDPQENLLQPFAVTDDDTVFRLQFDPPLAGGAVGVEYTVTAEDGHVLSGAFSFTISVDLPASTTAAPSTTEPPPVTTTTVPSAPATAASDVATTSPAAPTTILEDVSASEATGVSAEASASEPTGVPAEASASEPAVTQNGNAGDDSSNTGLLIGIAIAVAVLAAAFLVVRGAFVARSMSNHLASTPLDDFLAGAGSETDTGELLQRIGLLGSLTGLTLALGLIVFLAVVHTGRRSEIRLLLRVAGGAGALALIGAGIEIAGTASILDIGWADAVTETSSGMMRLLAGLLIALGLIDHIEVGRRSDADRDEPVDEPLAGADPDDAESADGQPEPAEVEAVRWAPSGASAFGICGALVGALSFGFDGHTVTEGPRVVHAAVNVVHVAAGSVWFGGVVGLSLLATVRRRTGPSTAPMIVRFSSIATLALIAVAVAGVLMSLMITDGFGDYTSTDWGRLLIIKTVAVGAVVAVGAYNHFVVVPKLELEPDSSSMLRRARTTITGEAAMLLGVAAITVFLSVASTN